MNPLKRLASQTLIYGLSSILGRFLNYLLVPLYTYSFNTGEYGVVSEFYAYSGFFAVLLVFGMETGFFRFSQQQENRNKVYATALGVVAIINVLFVLFIVLFASPLSTALRYPQNKEYFYWFAAILACDSIAAIPFAKLRAENKALRFASIKLVETGITVLLNIFFIVICRNAYEQNPGSFLASFYNPAIGVGYIFISNLIASAIKITLLLPMLLDFKAEFDSALFGKMLRYSAPMVVIGFAGIINEMLDRMILKYLLPFDNDTNMQQLGIYGACYKLSVLMTLFIQAFRYAAEPFFFAQAKNDPSRKIYADVMKYFVVVCMLVFLFVMLYLPWWQLFIGSAFRSGLKVVPVLLLANLFLGVYVNLSVWYKLTDNTMLGARISVAGALLTIALNIALVPTMGYMGSAWATLACYLTMAVVSYVLGQKYFPVPYEINRITWYIFLGIALWLFHEIWNNRMATAIPFWISGTLILLTYGAIILAFEKKNPLTVLKSAKK